MGIKLVVATQDHQFEPYPEIMKQGCIGMVCWSMGRERAIFQGSHIKSEVGCLPLYDTPEDGDTEHAAIFWQNKVILEVKVSTMLASLIWYTLMENPDAKWLDDLREKVLEFSEDPEGFMSWFQSYLFPTRP